jgi:zinc transporter ZupT
MNMFSRLILLGLQLMVAWFAAPLIVRYIPGLGRLELFVYAVVFAALVWLGGVIGAQVLKDTATPTSGALASALILAAGAAAYLWLPALLPDARRLMLSLQEKAYPLIGAAIGYHIRR